MVSVVSKTVAADCQDSCAACQKVLQNPSKLTAVDMNSTVPDGHELEQLRDVVGPEVSRRRLRDLLERAGGSVQRAVDLHFSAADSGNDVPEQVTLDQVAGPSTGPAQGNSSPRPTRRAVMGHVASPRHLADFVELSSSTDNDFDPGRAVLSLL